MSNVIRFPSPPIGKTYDPELSDETVDPIAERIHAMVHNMIIDELVAINKGSAKDGRYRLNYAWIAALSQGIVRRILEEVMAGADDVETLEVLKQDFSTDIDDCFSFFVDEKKEN